jgi:hypothetical protein
VKLVVSLAFRKKENEAQDDQNSDQREHGVAIREEVQNGVHEPSCLELKIESKKPR